MEKLFARQVPVSSKKEMFIFFIFESAKWLLFKLLGRLSGDSVGIKLNPKWDHYFGTVAAYSVISIVENIKLEEW